MDFDWYFIDISTGFPMDFHWDFIRSSTVFAMNFHWYFIEIITDISLKFQLDFLWIFIQFHPIQLERGQHHVIAIHWHYTLQTNTENESEALIDLLHEHSYQ